MSAARFDSARDDILAQAICTGNESAFRVLYLKYYARLVDFAASLRLPREDAEEIVQDVFVAIWINHKTWSVPTNVSAYLYRSARNRAIDRHRHQRHTDTHQDVTHHTTDTILGMGTPAATPDINFDRAELTILIDRAIATLPDRRREIVTLRWRHGFSLEEIAEIVGSTVKAVAMQIARSRDAIEPILRRALGE